MHVVKILRDYLGLSQTELANLAGITQADISEIENKEPYGQITKYRRLADALGVTVHALVMNNASLVPLSFFECHNITEYSDPLPMEHTVLGRQGEDAAFAYEKNRVKSISPVLAKLVLPYYKMKIPSQGYDILSYNEDGTPIYIEVKTTEQIGSKYFYLTKHELDVAKKQINTGRQYYVYYYTGWNTSNVNLQIIDCAELLAQRRANPTRYRCSIKKEDDTINGLVYFRQKLGLTQLEVAKRVGLPATSLCHYEQGERTPAVSACIKLASLFDVEIDALSKKYQNFDWDG